MGEIATLNVNRWIDCLMATVSVTRSVFYINSDRHVLTGENPGVNRANNAVFMQQQCDFE